MEIRQNNSKKNKEKKAKVKQETAELNEKSIVPTKRPSTTVAGPSGELKKKVKSDYSVAKDPQVSDVYKSLFTTHKSEQEQNRAHWVTYNPFYN